MLQTLFNQWLVGKILSEVQKIDQTGKLITLKKRSTINAVVSEEDRRAKAHDIKTRKQAIINGEMARIEDKK